MSKTKRIYRDIAGAYDALVMIHPDYAPPINPNYKRNLSGIIKTFKLARKPVFAMEPIATKRMRQRLSDAIIIPGYQGSLIENSRNRIDFIVKHVGKQPKDIKLAFGGIYANACVYAQARLWCKIVETNHPNEILHDLFKCSSINYIKFGKVLEEII